MRRVLLGLLLAGCSHDEPARVAPAPLPSAPASASPQVCEDKSYWLRWLVAEAKTGDPEALSRVALAGQTGDDAETVAQNALATAATAGDPTALAHAIQTAEALLPPRPTCASDDGGVELRNGRMPPGLIQHIVRQRFGRVKLCYQTGLVRNASLAGSVHTKFVIDRNGDVQQVSDATPQDRKVPDDQVTACVLEVFRTLRFPRPFGGIVTVIYPINLTPHDD